MVPYNGVSGPLVLQCKPLHSETHFFRGGKFGGELCPRRFVTKSHIYSPRAGRILPPSMRVAIWAALGLKHPTVGLLQTDQEESLRKSGL